MKRDVIRLRRVPFWRLCGDEIALSLLISFNKMKNITKSDFFDYIKTKLGINVTEGTQFFEKTGTDGLDAITFMADISKDFSVNLDGYNFKKYHSDEADIANIFKNIFNLIFNRKNLKKKTFTALHLYEVVCAGHWFFPVQNEGLNK
jgi:acyl carrier protein